MRAQEMRILSERVEERENYQQGATSTMLVLSVIFSVLTVLLFVFLLREFRRRVRYQDELQHKLLI